MNKLILAAGVLFCTLFTNTVFAQTPNTLNNVGLTASTPAVAAYSLNKLSSTYTGFAMQVRRSSDSTTQDIGFTPGGYLDTAALKAFVGANNGYATIWYDQSGYARDLTQTDLNRQPSIINNGTIYRRNGLPTLYYDNDGLKYNGPDYLNTLPLTVNTVAGSNSNNGGARRAVQGTNNWLIGPYGNNDGWYSDGWNYYYNASWSITRVENFTVIEPQSNPNKAWRDGASEPITANAKGVPNKIQTGTEGAYFEPLDGYVSEVLAFNLDLSDADRIALEHNQKTVYGIVSSNASLANLTISDGNLNPGFSVGTAGYTDIVDYAISTIKVTPTTASEDAVVQVQINNGGYNTVTNGSASANLALNVGANTIDIKGTAQDGVTASNYSITVYRAPLPPTVQATNVNFTSTGALGTTVNWTNGDGAARAVFISTSTSGSPVPESGITYNANPVVGSGMQIGSSGWYCVYNGTGTSVNVLGLKANTSYRLMTVEFNGSGGTERYLSTTDTGNPANVTTTGLNTLDKLGLSNIINSTAGIFALRSLSTDYTGPLTRINIGGNYYDVYPDASGDKSFSVNSPISAAYSNYNDAATGATANTLSTIVTGTTQATVAIWYDQSGNSNNAIQQDPSSQPGIIKDGVIYTISGKPSLKFTASSRNYFESGNNITIVDGSTANAVAQNISTPNNSGAIISQRYPNSNSTIGFFLGHFGTTMSYGIYAPGFQQSNFDTNDFPTSPFIATGIYGNNTIGLFVNRVAQNANGAADRINSTNPLRIGRNWDGDEYFDGYIPEVTLFTSGLLTADREAVEGSQYTYFGLGLPYVTTKPVTDIRFSGIAIPGKVVSDFGNAVTARGIVYSLAANPSTADNVLSNGTGIGDISTTVNGLNPLTVYHYRAFATNSVGTSYGDDMTFTTLSLPNALDNLGLTSSTLADGDYSMRLLSSTYAGPLARININNTYYDIYPDATPDRSFSFTSPISAVYSSYNDAKTGPTADLLSSIVSGSTTATVVTWYDQTGNANDAQQTNPSQQPEIINAGVIDNESGRPALKFSSQASTFFQTIKNVITTGAVTANAVAQNINTPGNYSTLLGQIYTGNTIGFFLGHFDRTLTFALYAPGFQQSNYTGDFPTTPFVATGTYGGNALNLYVNQVAMPTAFANAGVAATNPFRIGARWDGNEEFDGYIPEAILFTSTLSATKRALIENNQILYYNINAPAVITADQTAAALITPIGTASSSDTLKISATRLTNPVTITPPTGFEVSIDNITFAPTITIGSTGTLAETPVYVRLANGGTIGTYAGDIILSSAGAQSVNVTIASSKIIPVPNYLDKAGLANTAAATGSYSLRLLSSTYTGPLARINVNNTYYDVYPDNSAAKTFSLTSPISAAYSNYNDTPTGTTANLLSSIINSNSAGVAIWYDQSGIANDVLQSNPSQQPAIINSGNIYTQNGLPAIRFFASSGQYLRSDKNVVVEGASTSNAVAQNINSQGSYPAIISQIYTGGTIGFFLGIFNGVLSYAIHQPGWAVASSNTYYPSSPFNATGIYDGSSVNLYINGVSSASASAVVNQFVNNPIVIGTRWDGGGDFFDGYLPEVTLFTSVLTPANRQAIESNQRVYYILGGATVATNSSSAITTTTATLTGDVSADAGQAVSSKGIVYGLSVNPVLGTDHVLTDGDGIGGISVSATSLADNTTYHYRAFATNSAGTTYGIDQTFTTLSLPTVLDKLGLTNTTYAKGAYSLRLLGTNYTGPLVRITTGGSYYDVYPDANKIFSLTSPISAPYNNYNDTRSPLTANLLNSIINNNTATVSIWYDQSGSGNNGVQGDRSMQPEIINAGAIDLDNTNSLPAIKFDGTKNMTVTSTDFNDDLSGSVVYNATTDNNSGGGAWYGMNGIFGSEQPGGIADFGYGIYNGKFTAGNGPNDASVGTGQYANIGSTRLNSWTRSNATGTIDLYTSTQADGETTLNSGSRVNVPSISIGSIQTFGGGGVFYHGTISEMTLFPIIYSDTERHAIEGSQVTYYNISINTAPTDIALSATAIDENVAAASTIGTFTTTDTEGGAMTYALISGSGDTDNSSFTINGNELKINDSPDYESKNSYTVRVSATDNGGLSFEKQFTININDLAEVVINQSSLVSTMVGSSYNTTVSASGGTSPYSFAITSGALPNGLSIAANGSDAVISGQATASGSYNFTVTATDANNFTGSKALSISVSAGTPAITYAATTSKAYGDADFDPAASSTNATATISYSSSDNSIATIVNNKVHIVKPGTVTIYADQSADANYNAATQQSQTLTIDKKALTLTLNATPVITRDYTGLTDASLVDANYTLNGINGTDNVTVAGTATFDTKDAANGKTITVNNFILSGTDKDNYTLSTASATITGNITPVGLTITADNQAKVYGADLPALTASYSGFVNSETPAVLSTLPTLSTTATAASHVAGSPYTITPSGAVSANYAITYVSGSLSVTPASLTITADNQTKGYGTALPTLTASYTGFTNGDTQASLTTASTLSTTATASSSVAGSPYAITAYGAVDADYTITYAAGSLTVTPALLTITANNQTKAYGDALPTLTASYTGFLNGDTNVSMTTAPTLTTTATASSSVAGGPYAITASGAANSNYTISYIAGALTVTSATLNITADNQTKVYGATLPTLTASYSGFVNGDTPASLTTAPTLATTATAASSVAGGPYAITASGAANSNYTISYTAGALSITSATLNITADNQTKVYGAALPTLTASYSGFVNSDTPASLTTAPTLTTTATVASSVAGGPYAITASGAASNNYSISYAAGILTVAPATITVSATGPTKAYGQVLTAGTSTTNFSINGTLAGNEQITGVTLTPNPFAASATTPAGSPYGIAPSAATGINGFNAGNYHINYVAMVGFVDKASLTITATGPSKIYGTPLTAGASATNFISTATQNSEAVSSVMLTPDAPGLSATTVSTTAYAITPSAATGDGFDVNNYNITYVPFNGTVTKAPLTVKATDKNKTYGQLLTGGSGSAAFIATGLQNAETIGSVAVNYGTGAATNAAVNTYASQVTPSFATGGTFTAGNYIITYTSGDIIVGAAPLTVTATNVNKTYGQSLTGGSGSTAFIANGLQNSETVGSVAIAYGNGSTTNAAIGNYTGQVTPAAATGGTFTTSNYTVTYAKGDIIVGAKAISVTADAKTKVYGDGDPALTYTFSPALISGDSFTGTLSRVAGESIGTRSITQNTLALNSNYTLTYNGADLAITAKPIVVTANAKTKVYGDSDPVLTYTFSPALISGDSFTGALSRVAGESIGTRSITQNTLALNSNYTLTYNGADLTVTAKPITVTADAKTKTYGATDPVLTYTFTPALVTGDSFTGGLSRTIGENAGAYSITKNTLALNNNYTVNYTGADLTITKAGLIITADNKTKSYGAANPALTTTYAGFVNGDSNASLTTQPTVTTTATAGSTAGTYQLTPASAASNNYTFSYVNGTLTIANVTLTITANNQSKTYGQANPALTATYSGFVNGDTQASLTTLPAVITTATTASGVNTYPIAISGAVAPGYTIAYVPGTLTVTKAPLTITADNKAKIYGTANPTLTANYNGFVNGDTQASLTTLPTITNTATTTTAPGAYDITLGGAQSNNYTISYTNGTLTIIPLTASSLSNLTASTGTISPAFNSITTDYTLPVSYDTERLTLTPYYDQTASATINGTAVPNGSPSFTVDIPVGTSTIALVVTAQDGTTKTTYTISVYKATAPTAIIPTNILSPNGDGKNDGWVIKDIEQYPDNVVTIYDSGGRQVYKQKGYHNDWSGTVAGAPLAQGTYYYIVDFSPGITPIKGYITILNVKP